jgi:hypothetical protein
MTVKRNGFAEVVAAVLAEADTALMQPEIRAQSGLTSLQVQAGLTTLRKRGHLLTFGKGRRHSYGLTAEGLGLPASLPGAVVDAEFHPGESDDGWSINATGDLEFNVEGGDGCHVPRARIAALLEFIRRSRAMWSTP